MWHTSLAACDHEKVGGWQEVGEDHLEQESLCTPNSQEKGIPPSASSLVLDLTITRKAKLRLRETKFLAGTETGGQGIPCPRELLIYTWPH